MSELVRPTIDDTRVFLGNIGLPLDRFDLLSIFPGVFQHRRVAKVYDKKRREERVLKARPYDTAAKVEAKSMGKIMGTYRFSRGHFSSPEVHDLSHYVVFNMPFLGYDLGELAQNLNLLSLGYGTDSGFNFDGFTYEKINELCDQLRRDHSNFASKYRLIHGDLWQRSPNNIVYHHEVDRLLLVDPEGLGSVDEERTSRFYEQLDRVQEWMHESLLKFN